MIELRVRLYVTCLIHSNEVILEHIDEVLEAKDGIAGALSSYNL